MKRLDYLKIAPDAVKALLTMEHYVNNSAIEKPLLNLIKLRASQINGCAYCVNLHANEAKKDGESDRRINTLVVWKESPFFTDRERAALAWTEAVTLVATSGVHENLYKETLNYFSEKELVDLSMAIVTINSWNRMAVSFSREPKE